MREGIRELYILGRSLTGRHRWFVVQMNDKVLSQDLDQQLLSTFNLQYVQITNNHSEGYNNRLGTKRKLGKHPNVYKWTDDIISELQTLYDNILMEMAGNPNFYGNDPLTRCIV